MTNLIRGYIQYLDMKGLFIALLLVAAYAADVENHEGKAEDLFAVKLGYSVTYSSEHAASRYHLANLDSPFYCWLPRLPNVHGDWIQVSSPVSKKWTAVETQGCPHANYWITSYQVEWSDDGVYWGKVDDGYSFPGNNNRNAHVRHWFDEPVWARTIRLVPKSTYRNGWGGLRFDFIHVGAAKFEQ